MNKPIKDYIVPYIPGIILKFIRYFWGKYEYNKWKRSGDPIPPPHIVKQKAIEEYWNKYKFPIFIETGTYKGGMVEAQKDIFKKIISIEINPELCKYAKKRFRKNFHITILEGDSGKILPKILNDINEPTIFWLDGHYSGGITSKGEKDSPILEELSAIFNSNIPTYAILIDDARCFTGNSDYPSIENLTDFIKRNKPDYQIEIKDDIIRLYPKIEG